LITNSSRTLLLTVRTPSHRAVPSLVQPLAIPIPDERGALRRRPGGRVGDGEEGEEGTEEDHGRLCVVGTGLEWVARIRVVGVVDVVRDGRGDEVGRVRYDHTGLGKSRSRVGLLHGGGD
jgi:hypothetical protein